MIMTKIFITVICLFTGCASFAQKSYEVFADSVENNSKMLRGVITKEDINNDTTFKWNAESLRIYPRPDSSAVAAFKENKDRIYFIIFGGTWCEDTHFILPKFFKIQEVSGFPESHITVFAVDRHKHSVENIAQAMNITATPTIIVMKNGKEIGRLKEYGKTGYWDKELAKIIDDNLQ